MLILVGGCAAIEAAAQTYPAALRGTIQYELSAVQEALQPDCESSSMQATISAEVELQVAYGGAASYISVGGSYEGSFQCTGSGTIYVNQEVGNCSWDLTITGEGSGTVDLPEATSLFQIAFRPLGMQREADRFRPPSIPTWYPAVLIMSRGRGRGLSRSLSAACWAASKATATACA